MSFCEILFFVQKDQLLQYAMTSTGMMDQEIMEKAFLECFGKDLSLISWEQIDQTSEALRVTYEDIEIKLLEKQFSIQASLGGYADDDILPALDSAPVNHDARLYS